MGLEELTYLATNARTCLYCLMAKTMKILKYLVNHVKILFNINYVKDVTIVIIGQATISHLFFCAPIRLALNQVQEDIIL